MAEPFKTFLNPSLVGQMADHPARAWSAFDRPRFVQRATDGLEVLELKARAMQIADALEATLPADFPAAATVLHAAIAMGEADPDAPVARVPDDGLAGWMLWPVGEYVARHGLPHAERALAVLHALTQRFRAEFAIRPFLVAHPALVLRTLAEWVHDPSAHVRRLVSEGTRPRLPWGLQLKAFIADPSPTLPLLRALLRHASRTLIKRGDARVLHAWGMGDAFAGSAALRIAPRRVRVGESVTLTLALEAARTASAQSLAIDYVVHHVRANGSTSPKVFKGWTLSLAPGDRRTRAKRHAFRVITTRRYYPGGHRTAVQVNGTTVAEASVQVTTGA
jgi:3-methyladenine DNA glycosylase AlkC